MFKPFISNLIELVEVKSGEPVVVAKSQIPPTTLVEVCSTIAISGRAAVSLGKSNPLFEKRLILDQAVIDREYEVFTQLGELELERRLASGSISQAEYSQILRSKIDVNSMLEAKSHLIPLGYGMAYRVSDFPNVVREYHPAHKLCSFRAVQYIEAGTELSYFT
jgi:hypothetical protein